jgi:hypothetical protein
MLKSWAETSEGLHGFLQRQLFFIGGAPRSGTTWLQQILDSHPQASCKGEALFSKDLFPLLESCMAQRSRTLDAKNRQFFEHTGGYPLPAPEDSAFLAGAVILLAMSRQAGDKQCRAHGEKTPENVFFFETFRRLFPQAKFIAIARDPRDVLTSAWFFFRNPVPGQDDLSEKLSFIRSALPALAEGARAMIAFGERHPDAYHMVAYEGLCTAPEPIVAGVFRFLGLDDDSETVRDCIDRTSFAAMTGGRWASVAQNGSFLRKGIVGDWRSVLTPEMNELVLRDLGWMFTHFGWQP